MVWPDSSFVDGIRRGHNWDTSSCKVHSWSCCAAADMLQHTAKHVAVSHWWADGTCKHSLQGFSPPANNELVLMLSGNSGLLQVALLLHLLGTLDASGACKPLRVTKSSSETFAVTLSCLLQVVS